MSGFILRDYQERAVASVFDYLGRRDGNPLVVSPTGSGKAIMIAEVIKRALDYDPDVRFLMATHVKELIEQNYNSFCKLAPQLAHKAGIYSAGLGKRQHNAQILFAGVQSIAHRVHAVGARALVGVDESHLIPQRGQGRYRKLLNELNNLDQHTRIIGFTATPYRADSGVQTAGPNNIFTSICFEADMVELIDQGFLSEIVATRGKVQYDLRAVGSRGGDFVASELAKALAEQQKTTDEALDETIAEGKDRKSWLVFCASVAQAEYATEYLKEAGVDVALVTGKTDAGYRRWAVKAVRDGSLRGIVNVGVFTTGFDAPNIDLISMLRPTQSTGLYVQMAGRGLRIAPGKENCLLLDFGGNVARHGPINAVKMPEPKGGGEQPFKMCPKCKYDSIPISVMICPECDYEFPAPDKDESKPHNSRYKGAVIQRNIHQWKDVTDVTYSIHRKEGKPPSLKVTYFAGRPQICSEWICLEHSGYAQQKAISWMAARLNGRDVPMPKTVDQALRMSSLLSTPSEIRVDLTQRFPSILGYRWPLLSEVPGAEEERAERVALVLADMDEVPDVPVNLDDAFFDDDLPF